jgi:hypothetical protein
MASLDGVGFDISVVGDTTGETWAGSFKAKEKLSFRDQIGIDKMRRELLGHNPAGADPEIVIQTSILAELSVRLVETPAWWREAKMGLDLCDANVLMAVYEKAIKIQQDAIEKIQKAGEAAKEQLRSLREKQDK